MPSSFIKNLGKPAKKPLDDVEAIGFDIDGTLLDFCMPAALSLTAECNAIADKIVEAKGLSEVEQITAVQEVRGEIQNLRYEYSQEVETIDSAWFLKRLIESGYFDVLGVDSETVRIAARNAFHATRTKHTKLFPQIQALLQRVKREKKKLFLITDAPGFHAASRLKLARVNMSLFDGMLAAEDTLVDEIPEEHHDKFNNGDYGLGLPVIRVPNHKPNTPIAALEELTGLERDQFRDLFAMVGDSNERDMALARRLGSHGFHAIWGRPRPQDLAVLRKFAPAQAAKRSSSTEAYDGSDPRIIECRFPRRISQAMGWE